MRRVTANNSSYAVPFEKLFRPLTDPERAALRESIRTPGIGVVNPVLTYVSPTWGRSFIDGMHRAEEGESAGVPVPVLNLGEIDDELARQIALAANIARRHLSPTEQIAARRERLARITEHRGAGRSLRQIASLENISVGQAFRDLDEIRESVPGEAVDPENVVGADGKRRAARQTPPEVPTEDLPTALPSISPERLADAELKRLRDVLDGTRHALLIVLDLKGPRLDVVRKEARKRKVPLSKAGWPALAAIAAAIAAALG